jgi:hypothetical protein
MSLVCTCAWPIGNGQTLSFNVYDSNENWVKVGGLYIFAYLPKGESWYPLYVGKTDDFSCRFPSHERLDEAIQHGATHIHAVVVPLAANRGTLERRLIETLRPPMNEQLRRVRASY